MEQDEMRSDGVELESQRSVQRYRVYIEMQYGTALPLCNGDLLCAGGA